MKAFYSVLFIAISLLTNIPHNSWAGGGCMGGCNDGIVEVTLPDGLSTTDVKALREWARVSSDVVQFDYYSEFSKDGEFYGDLAYSFEVEIGPDKAEMVGITPGQYLLITTSRSYEHGYLLRAENVIEVKANETTPVSAKFSMDRTIEFNVSVEPVSGDFVEGEFYWPKINHSDEMPFSEAQAMEYRDGKLHGRFYVYNPESLLNSQQMTITITDEQNSYHVMSMDFQIMDAIQSESNSIILIQDPTDATGSVSVTFGFEDDENEAVTVEVSKNTRSPGYIASGSSKVNLVTYTWRNPSSENVYVNSFPINLKSGASTQDISVLSCSSDSKKAYFNTGTIPVGEYEFSFVTTFVIPPKSSFSMTCWGDVSSSTYNEAVVSLSVGQVNALNDSGEEVQVVSTNTAGSKMTIVESVMYPSFKAEYSDALYNYASVNEKIAELQVCASGNVFSNASTLHNVLFSINHNRGNYGTPENWMLLNDPMDKAITIDIPTISSHDTQVNFIENGGGYDTGVSNGSCKNFQISADTSSFESGDTLSITLLEMSWTLPDGSVVTQKYGEYSETSRISSSTH